MTHVPAVVPVLCCKIFLDYTNSSMTRFNKIYQNFRPFSLTVITAAVLDVTPFRSPSLVTGAHSRHSPRIAVTESPSHRTAVITFHIGAGERDNCRTSARLRRHAQTDCTVSLTPYGATYD